MKAKPLSTPANIEWDINGQPHSPHFDDVYFSKENGLDESRYVFLQGNHLELRWSALPEYQIFTIMETGFGTGLNFLAAWDLWNKSAITTQQLHFISIERFPLSIDALTKALSLWPELNALSKQLIDRYPPQPWQGLQRISLPGNGRDIKPVTLTILFYDVHTAIKEMSTTLNPGKVVSEQAPRFGEHNAYVDAWFLDGFAPAKNPDMWSSHLFYAMSVNSHPSSTFSTFTAAGVVRRGLLEHGFTCEKKKGFGRKREMILGQFLGGSQQHVINNKQRTHTPSWLLKAAESNNDNNKKARHVIIIGAGLAGCQIAYRLANQNFKVTLLEKNHLASGASSNAQGAIYTRLSNSDDPLSTFNLSAQINADQFYKDHGFFETCGQQSGVLHLATGEAIEKRLRGVFKKFEGNETYFTYVEAEQSEALSGLMLQQNGLKLARSGWLSPPKLCRQLIQHKNITLFEQHEVNDLHYKKNEWVVNTDKAEFRAPICVVCNASDAKKIAQLQSLPLKKIRGQTTHIDSNETLEKLHTVICGEGYLPPSCGDINGVKSHCIGATFNLNDDNTALSDLDHDKNMTTLKSLSNDIAQSRVTIQRLISGKVGFRSTTPDYFPIVGPVPKLESMLNTFHFLSKKANANIDHCGDYFPGLYCSLGFGSRGLAYTPLAADLITDLISNNYLSVPRSLYTYLHPARFLIRSLIKNKPLI